MRPCIQFLTGSNDSAVITIAAISPAVPVDGKRVCTISAANATTRKYTPATAAAARVYAIPRLKMMSTSISR